MRSILLIPFFLLSTYLAADHAVYISVLEVRDQQMTVKVFIDNLQDAVRNDNSSIEEYFQKKIRLQIDKKAIDFNLLEVSEEGDSYWITFKLDAPVMRRSFYLEADYFMELFPDQTNVVKVHGERPHYFRLNKTNPACSFKI